MPSLPIKKIHCNVHISTYVCRATLWTSIQVFVSNLDDIRLNAHVRNFATFRIVSWELLFMRVMRCFLGSRTLIMSGGYLLRNWLYTGHWNTKCISVSCLLAQNGHVVLSDVVENRCLWKFMCNTPILNCAREFLYTYIQRTSTYLSLSKHFL